MVAVLVWIGQAKTEDAMILAALLGSASDRLLYWWTLMRVASMRRRVRTLDAPRKTLKRDDE
jgi:hypothetical protein